MARPCGVFLQTPSAPSLSLPLQSSSAVHLVGTRPPARVVRRPLTRVVLRPAPKPAPVVLDGLGLVTPEGLGLVPVRDALPVGLGLVTPPVGFCCGRHTMTPRRPFAHLPSLPFCIMPRQSWSVEHFVGVPARDAVVRRPPARVVWDGPPLCDLVQVPLIDFGFVLTQVSPFPHCLSPMHGLPPGDCACTKVRHAAATTRKSVDLVAIIMAGNEDVRAAIFLSAWSQHTHTRHKGTHVRAHTAVRRRVPAHWQRATVSRACRRPPRPPRTQAKRARSGSWPPNVYRNMRAMRPVCWPEAICSTCKGAANAERCCACAAVPHTPMRKPRECAVASHTWSFWLPGTPLPAQHKAPRPFYAALSVGRAPMAHTTPSFGDAKLGTIKTPTYCQNNNGDFTSRVRDQADPN